MNNIQANIGVLGGSVGFSYTLNDCNGNVTWSVVNTQDNWFDVNINTTTKVIQVSCEETDGQPKQCMITPIVNGNECLNTITITQEYCNCNNLDNVQITVNIPSSGITRGVVVGSYHMGGDCPDELISFVNNDGLTFSASNGEIILTSDVEENTATTIVMFDIDVKYGNNTCTTVRLLQEGTEEKCICSEMLIYQMSILARTFKMSDNEEEIFASGMTTCGDFNIIVTDDKYGMIEEGYPKSEQIGDVKLFKIKVKDNSIIEGRSCGLTFEFIGVGSVGEECNQLFTIEQSPNKYCRCSEINENFIDVEWSRYSDNIQFLNGCGSDTWPDYSCMVTGDTTRSGDCYYIDVYEVLYNGEDILLNNTHDTSNAYVYKANMSRRLVGNRWRCETMLYFYNLDNEECLESGETITIQIKSAYVTDASATTESISGQRSWKTLYGTKCKEVISEKIIERRILDDCQTSLESDVTLDTSLETEYTYYSQTENTQVLKYIDPYDGNVALFTLNLPYGICCDCDWDVWLDYGSDIISADTVEFSTNCSTNTLTVYGRIISKNTTENMKDARFVLEYKGGQSCQKYITIRQEPFDSSSCISCDNLRFPSSRYTASWNETSMSVYIRVYIASEECENYIGPYLERDDIGTISLSVSQYDTWVDLSNPTYGTWSAATTSGYPTYYTKKITFNISQNDSSSYRYTNLRVSITGGIFGDCNKYVEIYQYGKSDPSCTSCTNVSFSVAQIVSTVDSTGATNIHIATVTVSSNCGYVKVTCGSELVSNLTYDVSTGKVYATFASNEGPTVPITFDFNSFYDTDNCSYRNITIILSGQ